MGAIVVLIGIGLVYLLYTKSSSLSEQNKLKSVAAFCCSEHDKHRYNIPLFYRLRNAQEALGVLEEYRLTEEDKENAELILKGFQKKVLEDYFEGKISFPKSKYIDNNGIYFMYLLVAYLEDHECDYSFLGQDMRKTTIAKTSWNGGAYDATYELTDFAVTYQKMLYAAYLSCKNSKVVNPSGNNFNNEHAIEDIIDSKRMAVSRM